MSLSMGATPPGSAQTGFTSPTYTMTADTAPTANGKQWAITAIGGTQTGVDSGSSVSRPWTWTFEKPATYRVLGPIDPVTGILRSVPRNTFKIRLRKGVTPLAGQSAQVMIITCAIDVPAGADVADAANIRAALSSFFGGVASVSAGMGDTLITGVM